MSAPDLQALVLDLLYELEAANKIIRNGLAEMTPAAKQRWAARNSAEDLIGDDGGTTRANQRLALIEFAGAALRAAAKEAARRPTLPDAERFPALAEAGAMMARCVEADFGARRVTFEPVGDYSVSAGWYVIIPEQRFNELVVMSEKDFDEFIVASQSCAVREMCLAPLAMAARAKSGAAAGVPVGGEVHTRAQEVQS